MIRRSLCLSVLMVAVSLPAAGQVAVAGEDTAVVVPDPGDVASAARAAQANFERRRARYFPLTFGSRGGTCDERVGRLCTWYGEEGWYPVEEAEEVGELRDELLSELDSLQRLSPGDGWILGQRVWYRAEGDDWHGALETARRCGRVEGWWCAALEGFALDGLGRDVDAQTAFDRALAEMDPDRAHTWRVPDRSVDSDARRLLEEVEEAGPEELDDALARLWLLADPLYVVEGNDRLTAHYARWTVATLKDGARNPFRLRWASDLEELTVRNGWEIGWERERRSTLGSEYSIIGHQHPEGRDYMPPGRVLVDPASSTFDDFVADRRRPSSLYAPPYAPVILPMEGQLSVFPRGDRMVVVATYFLPEDTTFFARDEHEHEREWMAAGDQAGMQDRIGLFAVPVNGGSVLERRRSGSAEGALSLEVPTGEYVISAETWSPEQRLAGRLRMGVRRDRAPDDIATLSNLLLLAPSPSAPASLAAGLPYALPRAEIGPEDGIAIVWEVSGLGLRPETLEYEVSVDRTDRNVLRRIGDFLGLSERPPSLALSWQEAGPERPTYQFRHLDLDLPPLDPGRYEITLVLRTRGRTDAVTRQVFTVVEPKPAG